MNDTLTKEQLISLLIAGGEKKIVLLFPDTLTLRRMTEKLSDELRSNPKFQVNRSHAYRIAENMIQVGEVKVFCGLERDKPMLANAYTDEQIRIFKT